MSAKFTPGPWFPIGYGTEKTRWQVMRDLRSGGLCQFMKADDGLPAIFDSEEEARAAIFKATDPETP